MIHAIQVISNLSLYAAGKIDDNFWKLDPNKVLINVLNMIYFVAGITAVIVIILAGYSFSSGSYDPAKIAIAKNALLYAVVGLIVVMMAFAATNFLAGRF